MKSNWSIDRRHCGDSSEIWKQFQQSILGNLSNEKEISIGGPVGFPTLVAIRFATAKMWNQPRYPLIVI